MGKFIYILILILLSTALLTACSAIIGLPNTGSATQGLLGTALPIPSELLQTVQQQVAQGLNVNGNQVKVVAAQQVDWTNSCLDLPQSWESCAQTNTPGYRLIVNVNGKQYEVRTDTSGQNVRWIVAPGTPMP